MADVTTLAAQACETRIRDNVSDFGGIIDLDRIAWQGMEFTRGEESWIRPTVLFGPAAMMTHGVTGTGQNLVSGLLQISVFTPTGYGMSEADGYASAARLMFDRVDIAVTGHGALEFGAAGAPRPGPAEDGWESVIVDCPFQIVEHGA